MENLCQFAQNIIDIARSLHVNDALSGIDTEGSIYALDLSTIDLCLSLFPWAKFRKSKSAVKMHTLLDLHGNIPTYLNISDGKLHDVNILDDLPMEAGAFYIMDRAYLDFERLYRMNLCGSFFVLRAKKNTKLRKFRSNPVDRNTGLICDQIVNPNDLNSKERYPDQLRRIKFVNPESRKTLVF